MPELTQTLSQAQGDETSVISGLTRNLWKVGVGLIQTLNQVQGDGLRCTVTGCVQGAVVRQAHQPWFDRLTNRGSTGSPTVVRQAHQPWFGCAQEEGIFFFLAKQ